MSPFWWMFWIGSGLVACEQVPTPAPSPMVTTTPLPAQTATADSSIRPLAVPTKLQYSWLPSAWEPDKSLAQQIAPPKGFERVPVSAGSFAEWLRYVPLHPAGTKVLLFDGSDKPYQDGAHRVLNIDIGKSDLQQCADAVMRLKAEYHYGKGEYAKIHFNYTSGDKVAFDDWRKGRQPKLSGGKVYFTATTGNTDNSYSNFKKYLQSVFMYAGTASLEKELVRKPTEQLTAGDVFIKGGFPGHAVLVMDVAMNPQTGERVFLLAQSYMPAQSIHILNNFNNNNLNPWYQMPINTGLATPEWDFDANVLRQFATE